MLWVWFMDLVPPYSFWGPGSGPLRKSFSFNGSLESKREGLTKQALCSPAPGAYFGCCKSLTQLKSSAMAEDRAPMRYKPESNCATVLLKSESLGPITCLSYSSQF